MRKVFQLKTDKAVKIDALEALAKKMAREGYVENAADQQAWDYLRAGVAEIDARIDEAERYQRQSMQRAIPVPGTGDRPPLRRHSGLRAFKDTTDRHGKVVRAEDQAFGFGQLIAASVFNSQPARDFLRNNYGLHTKAQTEGVNSAGGVLVPDQWSTTIINLKEVFGVFAREAQKVTMTSDVLNWPRRTGGVSAFFVIEGSTPTELIASFDNVALVAKKMMALTRISTELAEDAIISVADWIATEIAYAFSSKEDDCGFLSDGTLTYGGIRGLSNQVGSAGIYQAVGHLTADTLTNVDLMAVRGLLPQYAVPNAKWYCSQYFFCNTFSRLSAAVATGNRIIDLNNAVPYSFLGKPVIGSQKLPSTSPTGLLAIYYGDLRKAAAFGDRRSIVIKKSDERYFDTDQIGIQGTERIDINVHDAGTSSVAGPIVALKMG